MEKTFHFIGIASKPLLVTLNERERILDDMGRAENVAWKAMSMHQIYGDRSFVPVMLVQGSPLSPWRDVGYVPWGGSMGDKPLNINKASLV